MQLLPPTAFRRPLIALGVAVAMIAVPASALAADIDVDVVGTPEPDTTLVSGPAAVEHGTVVVTVAASDPDLRIECALGEGGAAPGAFVDCPGAARDEANSGVWHIGPLSVGNGATVLDVRSVDDVNSLVDTEPLRIEWTQQWPDACENISGTQAAVPHGLVDDGTGWCVQYDACPNLWGQQLTIPGALVLGGRGRCMGTFGADVIHGTKGADDMWGRSGNDVIRGYGGQDWISGGDGNDRISGNRGADILIGGHGKDVLVGGPGVDVLFGRAGNDVLNTDDDRLGDVAHCGTGIDLAIIDASDTALGCEAVTIVW